MVYQRKCHKPVSDKHPQMAIKEPTNWKAWCGSSALQWRPQTGKFGVSVALFWLVDLNRD